MWSAVKDNRLKTIKDLLLRQAFHIDDVIVSNVGHTILHESVSLNRYELFKLALIYNGIKNSFIF